MLSKSFPLSSRARLRPRTTHFCSAPFASPSLLPPVEVDTDQGRLQDVDVAFSPRKLLDTPTYVHRKASFTAGKISHTLLPGDTAVIVSARNGTNRAVCELNADLEHLRPPHIGLVTSPSTSSSTSPPPSGPQSSFSLTRTSMAPHAVDFLSIDMSEPSTPVPFWLLSLPPKEHSSHLCLLRRRRPVYRL